MRKEKIVLKVCVVTLVFLCVAQAGAAGAYGVLEPRYDEDIGFEGEQASGDEKEYVDLEGTVKARIANGLVYPAIDVPEAQTLKINTTKQGTVWVVNATVRLAINVSEASASNATYVVPRMFRVFAVMIRKDQPLISGMLRDVLLGTAGVRMNVFGEDTVEHLEIPLRYTAKNEEEQQRIFIVAVGSLTGFFVKNPPAVQVRVVDVSCQYESSSPEVIPPLTEIVVEGKQVEKDVFIGSVNVFFVSYDGDLSVEYTMYQSTITHQGVVYESDWSVYTTPVSYEQEGEYVIRFYSVDCAGNAESTKTKAFCIRQ